MRRVLILLAVIAAGGCHGSRSGGAGAVSNPGPANIAAEAPAPGGGAEVPLTPGPYTCHIGGHNVSNGFEVTADGGYIDYAGARGGLSWDASQSLLSFQGGAYDGQAAQVPNSGEADILNPGRDRIAISCTHD
jgi:hypothetical protein